MNFFTRFAAATKKSVMLVFLLILPIFLYPTFGSSSSNFQKCNSLFFEEYLDSTKYEYSFDVGIGNKCPFAEFPIINGILDSQKLQDVFKYSANPKLLPPTSQSLFNYFRRAKINCTFDLIHRIISRQEMNLTLAVNYDYGKDELRLYIFQQIENSTLPPQFELFMMKTNFTQYLKEMDDIKAVFDYSDAVMYVYGVDRKIKKTAFAAFHFIRDGKKLSVKEMGLSIENGMIDKFEIEPSGQYAYFTMANNLYRTRIEFPGPKIIDSSERVFLEIPMQSEDYIIAIHPKSFLIWRNRNGKREAILFEGLFFKDKSGVRRAKVNEIGCAFGGFQDDRESLRLRFRRKKLH